ncbi:MAG: RNA 2',3'-cyclic phosphodiesterase, partial [Bacteroidota bacterium]
YAKLRNELENEKIKWVDPQNFHLTLFFIGDTDSEQIANVTKELSNLADDFSSTQIKLEGLGVFKNINKPRVLWAGISEFQGLKDIKLALDKQMLQLGFNPDAREFKPHLTLARMKWIEDKRKLESLLKEYKDVIFQYSEIDQLIYYESILKESGPEYKPIEKFMLP